MIETRRTHSLTKDVGDEMENAEPRGKSDASIYADLLTSALASWQGEFSGGVLFDHVIACRIEMLNSAPTPGENAYLTLARDISYDRALIKLCVKNGIDARAVDFAHPSEERSRLERALADHDINLTAIAKQFHT
jgi:hypothetical protein